MFSCGECFDDEHMVTTCDEGEIVPLYITLEEYFKRWMSGGEIFFFESGDE